MKTFLLTLKFFFQQKKREIRENFVNYFRYNNPIQSIFSFFVGIGVIVGVLAATLCAIALLGFFIYLILYGVFGLRLIDTCSNWFLNCENTKLTPFIPSLFLYGWCSVVGFCIVSLISLFTIIPFYRWIYENWELAKERAQDVVRQQIIEDAKAKKKYR